MRDTAAAQRSTELDEVLSASEQAPPYTGPADDLDPPPFALKQQAAERIAAHRARRARVVPPSQPSATPEIPAPTPARSRSAHIAAAVAERYAQSPSYRTFLAAEAERSVRHAEAAADVALINAQAIAAAQQQLLTDLEHWDPDPEDFALGPVPVGGTDAYTPLPTPAELAQAQAQALENAVRQPFPSEWSIDHALVASAAPPPIAPVAPTFTVRLYDDAPPARLTYPERLTASHASRFAAADPDEGEDQLLDEEIAFRQDPIFEEPAGDPLPLTANLLEFPRQLIAARKARPRLAEGPLREDAGPDSATSQLRIFEVEPDQLSTNPPIDPAAPEWSSILLAAHRHTEPEPSLHPDYIPGAHIHTAPLHLRLMSALVDGAILLGALASFTGVFVLTVSHLSGNPEPVRVPLPIAAASAAAVLVVLTLAYHLIFFTVSDSTPGMRYARIALCTFNDENPTRAAIRRRLLFTALAALPLGIGLLWAFLDEDRLGWHDRLSSMYQRSY